MSNELDLLAIFAHPDDVELAVGGTLLKMKSLGYKTGAVDVTKGEMGTRGTVEGRAVEANGKPFAPKIRNGFLRFCVSGAFFVPNKNGQSPPTWSR